MDATCTIQDSIHVFSLVHKYVSRILGTYQVRGSFLIPGDGVKGSFLLFRYNEISVDGSLDEAVLVDFFLHLKELVKALLY